MQISLNLPKNPNSERASIFSISSITLILTNLFPLFTYFRYNWRIGDLLLIYWIETVIMGFFTLIKLLTNQNSGFDRNSFLINGKPYTGEFKALKTILSFFFVFHFGLFNLVHFLFLFGLFFRFLNFQSNLLVAIFAIFISHLVSLITNYYWKGEDKTQNIGSIIFSPYKRIIVMHIVLLSGGFIISLLEKNNIDINNAFIVIFVMLKILLDLFTHTKEHATTSLSEIQPQITNSPDSNIPNS